MLILLLVSTISAENKVFESEPYIVGASDSKVKVKYSVAKHILQIKLGTDDLELLTQYYLDVEAYYSVSIFGLGQSLKWLVTDYAGRESTCETHLERVEQEDEEFDICEATGCFSSFIDDGWCDSLCVNPSCSFDGKDCEDNDFPEVVNCNPTKIGNGVCDLECYNFAGFYDGGDCHTPCARTGCNTKLLGDSLCNYECFSETCKWDFGDCENCSEGCEREMLGDSKCDESCNNEACSWDFGDCFRTLNSNATINYKRCNEKGCNTNNIGDKVCDSSCNIYECNYDGGDCVNSDICFEELECQNKLGNRRCDTLCNVEDCSWDLGDCYAGQSSNYPQSSECLENWINDGICDFSCSEDSEDCSRSPEYKGGVLYYSGNEYILKTECTRSFSLVYSFGVIILLLIV